jgi:hypothetical protein
MVTPSAMIWIHDRDQAAIVVIVQRQNTDAEYLTQVLIRPYIRDAGGRPILCERFPKNHRRCQVAAKEAAFALCIHMAERRCRLRQINQRSLAAWTMPTVCHRRATSACFSPSGSGWKISAIRRTLSTRRTECQ